MNRRSGSGARRWLPYAIAAASGFLLAFLAVASVLYPAGDAQTSVRVPGVIGLPFADAVRRLTAAGLKATQGATRPSADAPPNAVVAQSPGSGETVERGTDVVLDLSEGVPPATIPQVVGASRAEAARELGKVGLELGDVTEQPDDAARGTVLAIAPAAGAAVPRGTRVAMTVSAGPPDLSLPDVVGRNAAEARTLLEQLGFQLAPLELDSLSMLPAGTVVAQSPAAGAAVVSGSTVTLRIARRP